MRPWRFEERVSVFGKNEVELFRECAGFCPSIIVFQTNMKSNLWLIWSVECLRERGKVMHVRQDDDCLPEG